MRIMNRVQYGFRFLTGIQKSGIVAQLVTVGILLSVLSASIAYADHPLWRRKRNMASTFLSSDSVYSSEQGRDLYQRAWRGYQWGPKNIVTWQGADPSEPLYFVEKCLILNGFPEEDCLRFNWNLNFASTPYLSWIFAHGYSYSLTLMQSRAILVKSGLSAKEVHQFLALLPKFIEVDQMAFVYAMRHWHQLVRNWHILEREISNIGTPASHDYAEVSGDSPEGGFSEVARSNHASLNEFYKIWTDRQDRDLLRFLTVTAARHELLVEGSVSIRNYLKDPKYKKAVEKILAELEEAIEVERKERP